jgi:tRNA G18 (ribose-2'-O)-methylase SpoU
MNNLNVIDKYKSWDIQQIKQDVQEHTLPYAVLMQHIGGDYNISTLVRNANAFGVRRVYYYGRKKWDRRGSVGTHHYTDLIHIDSLKGVESLKSTYHIVGIENNLPEAKDISEFVARPDTLFVFGEEGSGIQKEILDLCDEIVYIPQRGSVRSLNVGTCSGIVMNDYVNKLEYQNE